MNKLTISIIVPVYKVEQHIERCLRSVMRQDYNGGMECILIDDCTPDRSMEVAKGLIGNYTGPIKFITLRHEENRGLSAARNTGIDAATGDYIFFLDSDDEIMPHAMSSLVTLAEKYPGVEAVYGDWYVCRRHKFLSNDPGLPEYIADRALIERVVLDGHVSMTAPNKLLLRSSLFGAEGVALRFKEGILHEDELFNYFFAEAVKSIAISYIPIYVYYLNPCGITGHPTDKNLRNIICIAHEIMNYGHIPRRFRKAYNLLLFVQGETEKYSAIRKDVNYEMGCLKKLVWHERNWREYIHISPISFSIRNLIRKILRKLSLYR